MSDKQLLFSLTKKDFKIEYFCAGGNGGQNMQKNATACRITHQDSNAVGISRDERSQLQNKKKALERCVDSPEFKNWHKIEVARRLGKFADIEKEVEEWMKPDYIKVEVIDEDGKWVENV
jgi:protein subunit release factor A